MSARSGTDELEVIRQTAMMEEVVRRADDRIYDRLVARIDELRKEVASLREQLRLTNDKMAEQVRQARWEVADDLLASWHSTPGGKLVDLLVMVENVRAANAPKD